MKMKYEYFIFALVFILDQNQDSTVAQVISGNGCGKEESMLCSQGCTRNETGIVCTCVSEYILADDNRTCLVPGDEPRLVILSESDVNVFFTESDGIELLIELQDSHVTCIGFGPDTSLLLGIDNGKAVYRTSLDNRKTRKPEPLIDTGLKHVTSVVVDRVTSNIYIVDSEAGRIIVCTWTGEACSVILDHLQRPNSAALDATSKKLIWTEWGRSDNAGSIKSSNLAGNQPNILVSGLHEPQNLVYDLTIGALFWVTKENDGYLIHCLKTDHTQRKVFVVSPGSSPPSISVLANQLYVVNGNNLVVLDKVKGQVQVNKSLDTGDITMTALYHSILYDSQQQENPCDSSRCSHVCIPSNSNQGYQCLCPADMTVDASGKCTRKEGIESLIVSGMNGIYEVPRLFIGNYEYQARKLLSADVNCVVYDDAEKRVFFYDDSARSIQIVNFSNPQYVVTLYTPGYPVEGMALDSSSSTLYWTTTQGNVFTGKTDGSLSKEILSGLHRSRGVTVDSITGYMYVCNWGNDPQILRCYKDGSQCDTFIHIDKGHPNMVHIASPITAAGSENGSMALYWTDSKLNMIGYKNLDDDAVEGHIMLSHTSNPHPYSLVVTEDLIYFTDLNTRQVHYIEKTDTSKVTDIHLSVGSLYGIDIIKKENNVVLPTVGEKQAPASKSVTDLPDQINYTSAKPGNPVRGDKKDDSLLLVISLTSGAVLLLLIIATAVVCCHRLKQSKQSWTLPILHLMKSKNKEEAEGLVSDSSMFVDDQNFKNFDDIDYPDSQYCQRRWDVCHEVRETSMISTDSAFTEMKDFDTYTSIENLTN